MILEPPPILEKEPAPSPPPQPPRRGKRREGRRGTRCLNCFTPTTARYCPECGQENVPVNIGLWEIFREAVEEFVRFDSKLIRTLIPLVLNPGRLTREWAAGRRTTYLSPLKLYLTVTAVFFLILPQVALQNTGSAFRVTGGSGMTKEEIAQTMKDIPAPIQYPVGQLMKLSNLTGKDSANLLVQQMVEHFPTALFAMLPVFAGVLWLLYVRNQRYYVEHLVFALHCHAFYFVLLIVAVIVKALGGGIPLVIANIVVALWIPAYSYFALIFAYRQGWFKTGIKWFMLGFTYMFLLSFSMLASLVMAAADMPEPMTNAEKQAKIAADTAIAKAQKNPPVPAKAPTSKAPPAAKDSPE